MQKYVRYIIISIGVILVLLIYKNFTSNHYRGIPIPPGVADTDITDLSDSGITNLADSGFRSIMIRTSKYSYKELFLFYNKEMLDRGWILDCEPMPDWETKRWCSDFTGIEVFVGVAYRPPGTLPPDGEIRRSPRFQISYMDEHPDGSITFKIDDLPAPK
jgi:hypothetical protein